MKRLILSAVFAASVVAANANIIYDNGLPDGVSGNDFTQWIQAEDAKLDYPDAVSINAMRFWILEVSIPLTSLNIHVYNNYGDGVPSFLFSRLNVSFTRTATGNMPFGYTEYEILATFDPFYAWSDIPFYMGLEGNPLTNPNHGRQDIYWSTTETGVGKGQLGVEWNWSTSGPWVTSSGSYEHAFRLESVPAVPEPFTMSLAALGLGLALKRRRK